MNGVIPKYMDNSMSKHSFLDDSGVEDVPVSKSLKYVCTQGFWAIIGLVSEEIMRLIPVVLIGQYSDINNFAALAIGNMTLVVLVRSTSFGLVS